MGEEVAVRIRQNVLSSQLQELEKEGCFTAYSKAFQSTHSNIIFVLKGGKGTLPLGDVGEIQRARYSFNGQGCTLTQAFEWMCDEPKRDGCIAPYAELLIKVKANILSWSFLGRPFTYYLSERGLFASRGEMLRVFRHSCYNTRG